MIAFRIRHLYGLGAETVSTGLEGIGRLLRSLLSATKSFARASGKCRPSKSSGVFAPAYFKKVAPAFFLLLRTFDASPRSTSCCRSVLNVFTSTNESGKLVIRCPTARTDRVHALNLKGAMVNARASWSLIWNRFYFLVIHFGVTLQCSMKRLGFADALRVFPVCSLICLTLNDFCL
ncbi:MAG: hypothetical protein JWP47_906 [Polaromonas sp.]|nr:hypothetical protein [Polaromonas sp.]